MRPSWILAVLLAGCAARAAVPAIQAPAPAPAGGPTAASMLEPGPEGASLARQVGAWDVVMTIRTSPGAAPVVVGGMIAERSMVGLYLTEVMKPAPGSDMPDFRRFDHLTYNRVQARWDYVSLDTRAAIGIMYFRSHAQEPGAAITVYVDNFADPGIGVVGSSVRARHVDQMESDGRHTKRQYWTKPGRPEWLAVSYEYRRRP